MGPVSGVWGQSLHPPEVGEQRPSHRKHGGVKFIFLQKELNFRPILIEIISFEMWHKNVLMFASWKIIKSYSSMKLTRSDSFCLHLMEKVIWVEGG